MATVARFLIAAALAGCGGAAGAADPVPAAPPTQQSSPATAGVPPENVAETETPSQPNVEPIAAQGAPAEDLRVRLGSVELAPGDALRPEVDGCTDVLVYVREGALAASGTGIAEAAAPVELTAGDAARFGPEGDGLLRNTGAAPARALVISTRAPANERQLASGRCAAASGQGGSRLARAQDVEPLVVAGGTMRVRILLDAEGAGARHGGLAVLEADPDATVPEHTHEESAEILFIDDGDGEMRLGDEQVRIEPGVAVYVPPGALHDFRGAGTRPLRAIQVYAPSGPEQRFRRMAEGR